MYPNRPHHQNVDPYADPYAQNYDSFNQPIEYDSYGQPIPRNTQVVVEGHHRHEKLNTLIHHILHNIMILMLILMHQNYVDPYAAPVVDVN